MDANGEESAQSDDEDSDGVESMDANGEESAQSEDVESAEVSSLQMYFLDFYNFTMLQEQESDEDNDGSASNNSNAMSVDVNIVSPCLCVVCLLSTSYVVHALYRSVTTTRTRATRSKMR